MSWIEMGGMCRRCLASTPVALAEAKEALKARAMLRSRSTPALNGLANGSAHRGGDISSNPSMHSADDVLSVRGSLEPLDRAGCGSAGPDHQRDAIRAGAEGVGSNGRFSWQAASRQPGEAAEGIHLSLFWDANYPCCSSPREALFLSGRPLVVRSSVLERRGGSWRPGGGRPQGLQEQGELHGGARDCSR